MRRAARFLLYTLRPYLLILPTAATGAALLLPRIAGGTDGPAAALCNALPGFGLLFLLMLGMNLALSALPLALSLAGGGGTSCWASSCAPSWGPGRRYCPVHPPPCPGTGAGQPLARSPLSLVLYFGLALLAVLLGCLSGLWMRRSRLSGGLLYSAGLLLLMFLWPACRLILASPAVWGDLPLLLLLALPAAAALLELPLCRAMIRLSVR